jgi:hypothetical protein
MSDRYFWLAGNLFFTCLMSFVLTTVLCAIF